MSIVVSTIYLLAWYHYPGVPSMLGTLVVGLILAVITGCLQRRKAGVHGEKASIR
jgi:hypothetical protein